MRSSYLQWQPVITRIRIKVLAVASPGLLPPNHLLIDSDVFSSCELLRKQLIINFSFNLQAGCEEKKCV